LPPNSPAGLTPSQRSPGPERRLTICLGSEPTSLFLYSDQSYATSAILEGIYDGPIDTADYRYQPVILTKLPSWTDGDIALRVAAVRRGQKVVDNQGEVTRLEMGVRVRPAGCLDSACSVVFSGSPLTMDQMQVTFRLQKGLSWSDGESVGAGDSVFSYQLALAAPRYAGDRYWLDRTESYVGLDEMTVNWTGIPGFWQPEGYLHFWTPLPKHQLGHYSAQSLAEAPEVTHRPLSYGPYVVDRWDFGRSLTLVRNPLYFRAKEGIPHFDRVVYKFLMPGETALIALENGQCDALGRDTGLETVSQRVMELAQSGRIQLLVTDSLVTEYLVFGVHSASDYQRPAFFEDVRVRHAVAHCVNRSGLVQPGVPGVGRVASSFVPPDHPAFETSTAIAHPYDPDQGRRLLEAAGWRDADGDGVREAHAVAGIPENTPFRVRYDAFDSPLKREVAARIASDLAVCGLVVEPQFWETDISRPDSDGPLFGRRFDIAQLAWQSSMRPACGLFSSEQTPSEANHWRGTNIAGYENPAYDSACQWAQQVLPGTQVYSDTYRTVQLIFQHDLPALPLISRTFLAAAQTDLVGFHPTPGELTEFWNIETLATRSQMIGP
jgi:peptide/nickel transport system substrate-binding protein